MPTIHHSQIKKAEKMGLMLRQYDQRGYQYVEAFWPQRNVSAFGTSAVEALAQGEAMQKLLTSLGEGVRLHYNLNPRLVSLRLDDVYKADGEDQTPHGWQQENHANAIVWATIAASDPEPVDDEPGYGGDEDGEGHSEDEPKDDVPDLLLDRPAQINGVPTDGAVAYKQGVMTPDCPYDEGTDDFERWCQEWDTAADAATEEEEAEKTSGSVVAGKYRAKYAEQGHPTHCGDWLAETLNNLCANKEGTDLVLFEAICALNGVDTSKYNRTSLGWQGRIRMTGRNLLAKRVYQAGGVLKVLETLNGGEPYKAPADWMAAQRFKMPKADQ